MSDKYWPADIAEFMPRITTGNTMATCVVIGEQAADLIRQTHGIGSLPVSAVAAADQVVGLPF